MASIRICFNAYAAASAAALWLLLLHTWIRCDEFYAAVASLTTSKIALAVSSTWLVLTLSRCYGYCGIFCSCDDTTSIFFVNSPEMCI